MSKKMRTSTAYSNTVGTVILIFSLGVIVFGLINGMVVKDNFVALITILFGAALAFFGINVARITTENINSIKSATDVAITPEAVPVSLDTPTQTVDIQPAPPVAMEFPPSKDVWETVPKRIK